MNRTNIDRRIRDLEEKEAIKELKARYCYYCDDQYNPDGIAGLFTIDGIWDGGIRGKNIGRESIRSFFKNASSRVTFAIHNVMNPIITIDGSKAHGSWYLLQACVENGEAHWVSGRYEEDYSKIDNRWYFKKLEVRFSFWSPYVQGWTMKRDS